MKRIGHRLLPGLGWLLAGVLMVCAQGTPPAEVGIDERLGAQVALDAVLKDEEAKDVRLRELIDKPTILTLNYFRCTGICTPLLNGLVDVLNQIELEPGKDFQVVTVSFDPSDTPEVASQKRINYLKQMNRPFPPTAWHFLTGTGPDTKAVADSVGFHFRAAENGFIHPGAIIALTNRGNVSRYLYGISFLPADLQMAVREAAAGEVRPTISKILSLCYNYDPEGRRYVFSMTRTAGAITLVCASGFVLYLIVTGRARRGQTKEK